MLDEITPVLLTYDEAPNIGRTLSHLTWAKDIVIVDSGSNDGTLDIIASFPHVRVFHRAFDSHGPQWAFAVHATKVATPWILRLDADYQMTDALVAELSCLKPDNSVSAYRIAFDYAIFGRRVVSSLYPANTILLRRGHFSVADDGHTEKWAVEGRVETLNGSVIHDDWKSTDRWVRGQCHYIPRDLVKLNERPKGLRDWLRLKPPLMPIAVFLYCLFGKRLIFSGRAGLYYAIQRLVTESILSLMILEQKLTRKSHSGDNGDKAGRA